MSEKNQPWFEQIQVPARRIYEFHRLTNQSEGEALPKMASVKEPSWQWLQFTHSKHLQTLSLYWQRKPPGGCPDRALQN
eukprot:4380474-Amphidinium_carterae.2